jgi:hypothetical protein
MPGRARGGGGAVVDAGEVEGRHTAPEGHPLIAEHLHAQGGQVAQPGTGVDEALVVAGDDVDARPFVLRSRCPPNDTDTERDDGRRTTTRTVRAVTSPVGSTCRGLPQR